MATKKEERERKIVASVMDTIKNCNAQTLPIRNKWRDNFDIFLYGTPTDHKKEWQVKLSINKLGNAARTMQGELVSKLVNQPDWYSLEPRSPDNKEAEFLAPAFKKMLDYYLASSNFKRHCGSHFLMALIAMGTTYIGWTQRMVQNPEYVLKKTEKERERIQKRLASKVENPQFVDDSLSGQDLEDELEKSLEDFTAEATGTTVKEAPIKPYIQIGCLDIRDINHERTQWDPNIDYMEDSMFRAFDYDTTKVKLRYLAKLGLISRKSVERIQDKKNNDSYTVTGNFKYKGTVPQAGTTQENVKITSYYGPLVIDGEVVEDKYFCLIANDSILLKDGDYPYWEPPGRHTPVISSAVRQVPYRPTGAGIGDQAAQIQKIYDSNWQLICDTFRFGISGVNVIDKSKLVDQGQLDEGVHPGITVGVRGEPDKVFKHYQLTANLENQIKPIQAVLEEAINEATGVNELQMGGNNPYSRTSASETNARVSSGQNNVNIIALDLEQNFLIPALQTSFARVLQFGISEINTNPELQSLLNEDELYELGKLAADSRMQILNQWYNVKISGFSSITDKEKQAQGDNELLQVAGSNPVVGSVLNIPELMKTLLKNRGIKEPEKLLITASTPLETVTKENELLMSGHLVIPNQNDDHEFHMQQHQALAQSPYATPEIQQHLQIHTQMLQQMQMMMQAQAEEEKGPIQ